MILDHGDHRVLNVLLLVGQPLVHVLLELLGQRLDDDVGVADLLAILVSTSLNSFIFVANASSK